MGNLNSNDDDLKKFNRFVVSWLIILAISLSMGCLWYFHIMTAYNDIDLSTPSREQGH